MTYKKKRDIKKNEKREMDEPLMIVRKRDKEQKTGRTVHSISLREMRCIVRENRRESF